MKKVLCFGDSNTYGYIPENGERYDQNTRWTGVLQSLCGGNFEIIEAGCNNRTAFSDNPAGIMQTGYKVLPEFLKIEPDIVILAIGINDLQFRYKTTENDFKKGLEKLIDMIRPTPVILVAPAVLTKHVLQSAKFSLMFDETSIKKSLELPKIYSNLAEEKGCKFLDLNACIKPSKSDGLHYGAEEHKIIAHKLFQLLLNP